MSSATETILLGFAERATYLVPVIIAAFVVGEPLARLARLSQLRALLADHIDRLNTKLNRPKRNIATRLYRGMAALVMVLAPALFLGVLLLYPAEWVQLLATLVLVALLGELLRPYQLLRLRREAKAGTVTLQSTDPAYLFADTHALLRYYTHAAAERMALLVGASLYFLAAALPGLLLYLALAAAARSYTLYRPENRAFGWAACGLFALVDALPRFLSGLLLWLAALATPRTTPFAALRRLPWAAQRFHGWLAYLLHVALGGPTASPGGDITLPWIGTGPAKLDARHLSRALQLVGVTGLLWILLLSSTIYLFPAVK